MTDKIPLFHLDRKLVEDIYDELAQGTGISSDYAVYKEMVKRGYYNQFTGKPFTRMAIYHVLSGSKHLPGFRGKGQHLAVPLIVTNPLYPNISKWLQDNFPAFAVLPFDQLQVKDVANRDVYGAPPVACMLAAKHIYWPYFNGHPLLDDIIPSDDTEVFH